MCSAMQRAFGGIDNGRMLVVEGNSCNELLGHGIASTTSPAVEPELAWADA
ncbi:hypothetical protein SAMN04487951_106222 [Vreelandella arcis]|uniref:Uncharacterized protein n=1 Tax=Vreelandella arcis TaxID=416873 RepID=A0A1H0CWL9_9GAMM|nr:hypothetical protein SAMN04487951_106222 [Halomonas arcis]